MKTIDIAEKTGEYASKWGLTCDGVVSRKATVTRRPDPVVIKTSELQDDGDGDPYYILTTSDDRIEGYQYANKAAPNYYWINVYLETIGDDLTDIVNWVEKTHGVTCRIEKD